jgi:hypothetical protein
MSNSQSSVSKEVPESLILTVWPTIGATATGRMVGRLAGIRWGVWFLTVGNLLALATIPVSLVVFCWQLMPIVCRRYAMTNRKIVVRRGLSAVDGPSIGLGEFDAIEVVVTPGQEWLHAGDVVFRREGVEVFRLPGVSRPEIFRVICLTARNALLSVQQVIERQAETVPA